MRHLNEYQHHLRVLLEPYDAKVSRTVLRGESPSNGADLLDPEETGPFGRGLSYFERFYSVSLVSSFYY